MSYLKQLYPWDWLTKSFLIFLGLLFLGMILSKLGVHQFNWLFKPIGG